MGWLVEQYGRPGCRPGTGRWDRHSDVAAESPESRRSVCRGVRLLELADPDLGDGSRQVPPLRWWPRIPGVGVVRRLPTWSASNKMAVESRSRPAKRLRTGDVTEVSRFLRLAREYERLGDRARAMSILESVLELVEGQREWESERKVARELLGGWRKGGPGLGWRASRNWRRLQWHGPSGGREDGRIEDARRVWESIVELYAGDARVRDVVAEARRGAF
ncbi:MAG: hypothetical protein Ct9H300mP1_00530 [Planctomycetaceae bacterium]|nr:MAG: hypothetical protein Ct9H300mP1_00530 [Planctomycetaceae bacterium]